MREDDIIGNVVAGIALSFVSFAPLFAQSSNLNFDHIGLEQGLSQSTVYTIVQDAQGFLWFGTQGGLNRYDGYSIVAFKHNAADEASIADNSILCLRSDSRGDLWVGTIFGGLDRYVLAENKFHHHLHNRSDSASVSDNRINVLFEDSQRNIWVGTPQGLDLYCRETDSFAHIRFRGRDRAVGNPVGVNAICEDRKNRLWIGTTTGLMKLDTQGISGCAKNIIDVKQETHLAGDITSLFVDRSGALWVGTKDQGLRSYNVETRAIKNSPGTAIGTRPVFEDANGTVWLGSAYALGLSVLNPRTQEVTQIANLQNDMIIALYEDNSGILWIGTYLHGVYAYDPRNNRFKGYLSDPQNPILVMAILQDRVGDLWVGTFGSGLKRFDAQRNVVATFLHDRHKPEGIGSNRILSLAESSPNSLWIGTVGGGLDRYDKSTGIFEHHARATASHPNGLSGDDVTALYADGRGDLWIGYYSGELDRYDHASAMFTRCFPQEKNANLFQGSTITIIREASQGILWIGTHGSGLLSYDPKDETMRQHQLSREDQKQNSESVKEVSTLFVEKNGLLWIGSSRNGLIRFDPVAKGSTFFTSENGLPDNVIYGILSDQSGNLWISTNAGICRFNPKSGTFKNFDKNDGLQANEFNQGAYFENANGELFFGGVNGMNSFSPGMIKDNTAIPPVYLTSFKVFDEAIPLPNPIWATKNIRLSYSQNFFSFEFVALSYTSPEKNQYAYLLEGFDKDWHRVSASNRYASYTNLDPGEYTLRVRGSNNDGIWNEAGASLTLVITPPFWMTWWFRILLAVAALGAVALVYNYRVKQLLKIERMRLRIATDLHDELGSDLSAIALTSQMTKGLDHSDRQRLDKIRENSLRVIDAMREIVWFIRPEHDDGAQLVEKMKDLADSMLDGVSRTVNLGSDAFLDLPDLESRRNLFLIYKECLTNIVRHARCSHVTIDIGGNDGLLLRISDNGVGFDPQGVRRGSGLNNLQVRSERLHALLHMESSPNNGTVVEVRRAK
ncbi:MAG: hypothetical protein HY961_17130 [Ignavibacteriae bacterium]|nr:hypothetical protein [Ignavibacteriota bacterium]